MRFNFENCYTYCMANTPLFIFWEQRHGNTPTLTYHKAQLKFSLILPGGSIGSPVLVL